MDPGLAAIMGAFIGAIAGAMTSISIEWYRRHRDRHAVASVLAGEIASILKMTEIRGHKDSYQERLKQLDEGKDVPMPDPLGERALDPDPVLDRHLDKVGLLTGDLPERVVLFYLHLKGIRFDTYRLARGGYPGAAAKAAIIRKDMKLWEDTEKIGQKLISDLKQESRSSLKFRLRR